MSEMSDGGAMSESGTSQDGVIIYMIVVHAKLNPNRSNHIA